ncbi:hypothetical protein OHJ21_19320 [Virgibacillus sp. LDC1]|nr:hypothetical protein [Virgibacillus sp. LDC1]
MAKFKFVIYSPYVGADITEEIEIPDEELDGLSEEQKHELLNKEARVWMLQNVEYGWEEI